MSETWTAESCPACSAKNWICHGDPDDGDSSKMDVDSYTCRSCAKVIRLMGGQYQDELRPHVDGTEPWDDNSCGMHVEGQAEAG